MSRPLEVTAGQTAPIRIALEQLDDDGVPMTPDLSGVTPHLTIVDRTGVRVFQKSGTVESPAATSGVTRFLPGASEIGAPSLFGPEVGFYQVRVRYADGSDDYFPRNNRQAVCLIYPPLG